MRPKSPRLAVRAVIVEDGRLLLVNAWTNSDLMCAPGGGVEPHTSLPENLIREVHEETGLTIEVGEVCLINEFHDPGGTYHQVEIFFRAKIVAGEINPDWKDVEDIVTERRWVSAAELATTRFKPDALATAAFGAGPIYDPLEPIVKT